MKCGVMPCLVQLERKELQKLFAQVKETLATDVLVAEKKTTSFGQVDLGKARKAMKTAARLSRRPRILPLV